DAGVGKTRLAFELRQRIERDIRGAAVIELRARGALGNDADETFRELLRRALELPAERPSDGGRALFAQRLRERRREVHAAAALVLGWIAPDDPALAALRAAPGVLRANVARAGME